MKRNNELRRTQRIDLQGDATASVHLPEGESTYEIREASHRGLFLVAPEPLPLQSLIRIEPDLGDGTSIEMMGLVAHQRTPEEAKESNQPPGMGIRLFSIGRDSLDRWTTFVQEQSKARADSEVSTDLIESPHLVARLPDEDALERFLDLDTQSVELFVHDTELHDFGTRVVCELVHPTGDASLALEAEVTEVVQDPPRDRGVELTFEPLDEARYEQLEAFVLGEA